MRKENNMRKSCLAKYAIGSAVMSFTWLTAVDLEAAVTYRTVALVGDPAPGVDPGFIFGGITEYQTAINDLGQVAFMAPIFNPDISFSGVNSIWSEGSGVLAPVFVGDRGTVFTGSDIFSFTVAINNAGQTAFLSVSDNDNRIWSEGSGSLRQIANTDGPSFGAVADFDRLDAYSPVLNHAGQTAFLGILTHSSGQLVDASNDEWVLLHTPGNISSPWQLIAREGAAAPGTDPGVVFGHFIEPLKLSGIAAGIFPTTPVVLNNTGQTAFWGTLTGPGVDASNDTGIWTGNGSSLALVARAGDPAPGMAPGVVFSNMGSFNGFFYEGQPTINDGGQIAFRATLAGPNIAEYTRGIWLSRDGSVDLIAHEDGPAPGTEPGVKFFWLWDEPSISATGDVVFSGRLTGPGVDSTNDAGIWHSREGIVSMLAREGDPAPGMGSGHLFNKFDSYVLNELGQIALVAEYTGPGVNGFTDNAVWVTDADGKLTLIVQEGDTIDINDDPLVEDLRVIDFLSLADRLDQSRPSDGRPTVFNNAGQLALYMLFEDGSKGIVVMTVPEPGMLGVFTLGAMLIVRRRV